jgi:hypothetical protein
LHACDVLLTTSEFIINAKMDQILELNELDILATMFAALMHDFRHPGFNNSYLVNSKSDIAFQFNGKKILITKNI